MGTASKIASKTALSYSLAPYRRSYAYDTPRSYDRYRYDDDMYGNYMRGGYYSRSRYPYDRYDDYDKATYIRRPFYYDGRDNNYRSYYYGYGRDRWGMNNYSGYYDGYYNGRGGYGGYYN